MVRIHSNSARQRFCPKEIFTGAVRVKFITCEQNRTLLPAFCEMNSQAMHNKTAAEATRSRALNDLELKGSEWQRAAHCLIGLGLIYVQQAPLNSKSDKGRQIAYSQFGHQPATVGFYGFG